MATNQKIKACPNCNSVDHMAVYKYDSGWCFVECTKCNFFGPGEGSIRAAIKTYNEGRIGGVQATPERRACRV